MIFFWLFLLTAVVLFNNMLRENLKTIITRYQFNLYRLRDELREAVMLRKVRHEDWVFLYLDSSIARTIEMLERITFWHIIVEMAVFEPNERFIRATNHLHHELSKSNKHFLKEIYTEYNNLLAAFIRNRHPMLEFTNKQTNKAILTSQTVVVKWKKWIRQKWKRAIELQTEVPETSTLLEYAPG